MLKAIVAVSVLGFLFALSISAQQTTSTDPVKPSIYSIPVAAAAKENPVKATAESLARGKRQYGIDCAMCHGKEGDGKGDVAADLKLKMHDYTDPGTLKGRTDGELFHIITNGKDQMPPEGNRVKTEEIWDMVNYLRSFSKKGGAVVEKPAEEKPAEEKAPN